MSSGVAVAGKVVPPAAAGEVGRVMFWLDGSDPASEDAASCGCCGFIISAILGSGGTVSKEEVGAGEDASETGESGTGG